MKQLTKLRKVALAGYLQTISKDIKHLEKNIFSRGDRFYLVLLDHEADIAFNKAPRPRTAIPWGWNKFHKENQRGVVLATDDWVECSYCVDDTLWFFIYQITNPEA